MVILIDNHIFTHLPFQFDENRLRASIRSMLDTVRPLRVIVFAVGHDGHAQYPSRFFPPQQPSPAYPLLKSPGQDLMQIWREETTRTGTGMFIYVSTLRNDALTASRPEWLRIFGNGQRATVIDHNSGYLDEILLPGLQELIDRYQPDGFFLDADYWTLHESWHPASIDAFKAETGLPVPKDFASPSYPDFVRHTYTSYRNRYVQRLADFFSAQPRRLDWSINAAFTVRDPTPVPDRYGTVTIDLPFFALGEAWIESLFSQRLDGEAEIVYPLFAQSEGATTFQYKGQAQLRQELAVAVANRSLMSFYLPLEPDGTIPLARIAPAIAVYDEYERHIGLGKHDRKGRLVAPVAIVNSQDDALTSRRFSELRATSLQLFEQGIAHALTTDALVDRRRHSHRVYPRLQHPADPDGLVAAAQRGTRIFAVTPPGPARTAIIDRLMRAGPGAFVREPDDACPAPACERFLSARQDGEVRLVATLNRDALDAFLADAGGPIRFPGKPDYVYALAYADDTGDHLEAYLGAVAWGGLGIGRHTLFDQVDPMPAINVAFDTVRRCTQRTLAGETRFEPAREITLRPFDALTRLTCER